MGGQDSPVEPMKMMTGRTITHGVLHTTYVLHSCCIHQRRDAAATQRRAISQPVLHWLAGLSRVPKPSRQAAGSLALLLAAIAYCPASAGGAACCCCRDERCSSSSNRKYGSSSSSSGGRDWCSAVDALLSRKWGSSKSSKSVSSPCREPSSVLNEKNMG